MNRRYTIGKVYQVFSRMAILRHRLLLKGVYHMPARVISSCVDVHWRYTFDGNQCENIFQYAYPEGVVPTAAQLSSLADNLVANLFPTLRFALSNQCFFRELFIRDMHAASGRAQHSRDLGGVTGQRSGDPTSGNVAVNLISRTGFTGRNNHGAKRIGPPGEGDVSANTIISGLITALINLGLQWLTTRSAGGITWTPAVASAATHSRRAMQAVVLNNNFVDSQKTRLTGHGE
jgi:hypothetical protein